MPAWRLVLYAWARPHVQEVALMSRVTMRDLARSVGVSSMTVSRALRDDPTVSAATKARICKAADELGYVYDSTAQAFRTQKSGFVAVTLPSINNANFAETYRALSTALGCRNIQILLGATNYSIDHEETLIRQLLTRNPEALVVTGGHHTQSTRDVIATRRVPVVEIWDLPQKPLGHVVGFSNAAAMRHIVRHLVEKGARKLAFVGAASGGDFRGVARRQGTIEAAQEMGLPAVHLYEAGPAPISMRQGAAFAASLGLSILEFDAIVCVSDPVAFGVLNECRRMGVDVPGQLAIAGFGNFDVAAVSEPRITTMDVDASGIGDAAAHVLLDIFAGRTDAQHVEVGMQLRPGGTT